MGIHHRELLSEHFSLILQPEHTGKLLQHINDNTCAENWTDRNRHRDHRVEQVLASTGLSELLLKLVSCGARVDTKANFADLGMRKDLEEKFWEELAKLEERYGWKATRVEVPGWLRKVGWDQVSTSGPESDWFRQALLWLDWLETSHPGLVEKQTGVPVAEVQRALEEARDGVPIGEFPSPEVDFVEEQKSPERVELTRRVPPTANTLQKKLTRLVEKCLRKVKGTR